MHSTILSVANLGALLIVRNAQATIATALHSLLPVCSTILVVDTGSDDGTPALCTRLGAEVHFFRWCNDFSAARNYGIERMRTEWILSLDADESLDPTGLDTLPDLLSHPDAGGIRLSILNTLSSGMESTHTYPRIIRRHPAIRYRGAIHEQISDSILEAGFSIIDSSLLLHHSGYAHVSPDKIARNASLLRQEFAKSPHDPWLCYHLGLTEFAAGNQEEALSLLTKALTSGGLSEEQQEMACLRIAQIALAQENWTTLEKYLSFQSGNPDREGFRHYIRGIGFLVRKKYIDALEILQLPAVKQSRLVDGSHVQQVLSLCKEQLHSH